MRERTSKFHPILHFHLLYGMYLQIASAMEIEEQGI